MTLIARLGLAILLLMLMIVQPALAFDYPLSPEAIREAYFLGKASPEKRQAFFEPYRQNLPVPKSGPNVALIEVETPFACVVDAITHAPASYHAPDAEQDYLGKSAEFRVHVEIYFTETYPKPTDTAATLGDFWRDFQVHMKQKVEVPSRSIHGQPIYSDDTISGYIGAMIDVSYDVEKVDSGELTTVEVDTPDGQQVEANFSFNELR